MKHALPPGFAFSSQFIERLGLLLPIYGSEDMLHRLAALGTEDTRRHHIIVSYYLYCRLSWSFWRESCLVVLA